MISTSDRWRNAPFPPVASKVVSTDAKSAHSTLPASWKRSAAQISRGKTRKSRLIGLSTAAGTMTRTATPRQTASAQRRVRNRPIAPANASRSGATSSTPIVSPAHQASQTGQNSLLSREPVATCSPTPAVELISMAPKPPRKTRQSPSRSRAMSSRKPTRLSSRKAHSGAAVLLTTVTTVVSPGVVREAMTRKQPRAIPGQTRTPSSSRAATATPVGGQIGVTTTPSTTRRPSRPSRPTA